MAENFAVGRRFDAWFSCWLFENRIEVELAIIADRFREEEFK